jgi:HlyD family secretion protein
MDVKKTKKKNKLSKKSLFIASAASLVVVAFWLFGQSTNTGSVNRSDVLVGKVVYGDLDVQIEGYGVLRSNNQKIVIATSNGTVEQIFLKPGAPVEPDSIILKLSNPALEQQALNARQELELKEGDLRQLVLTNERDLLSEEAALASISAQLASAKLLHIAKAELVEKGIISTLELKEVQLDEEQLDKRVEIQNRRYQQLKLVHQETIKNQQQKIKQQQGSLAALDELKAQLTVRASMRGVLQELPVEPGQGLLQGQQVALISSTKDLVAMVKVSQSQIEQVAIGQPVTIDTRRGKIQGKISRIDPAVVEGTVTVEVALLSELPASARPELNIDAEILTESLKDVYYIERPTNSRADTVVTLFKLNSAQDQANAVQVSLGVNAGRFVQIITGASQGDVLILSDMSKLIDKSQLSVVR